MTTSRLANLILMVALGATPGFALVPHTYAPGGSIATAVWDTLDLGFTATEETTQPFTEHFAATLQAPDGELIRILGFYNGDRQWVLRFSPRKAGSWTFTTDSSLPSLAGLRGQVQASPARPGRHGAMVVSPANPQRFAYEDGQPCFLLAFECDWLFALDYGQPRAEKTAVLVSTLRQQGFNQVIMNVFAYNVAWPTEKHVEPRYEFGNPTAFPFLGSNANPDYSALNIDFFKNLDRTIALLDDNSISAHLMIYVWNKQVNWPAMNSAADNLFFDYVIKRYQAFSNIVWDVSKEALDYNRCTPEYIKERIGRIRQLDSYRRLLSVHDYGYCSKYPETVDFISAQTWTAGLHSAMTRIRETFPTKPIFNIEHGGYEAGPYLTFQGAYEDPALCAARNWETIFAGCYSTYYWLGASWNIVIYDPLETNLKPKPRLEYYRHMAELFRKYDFTTFKPLRVGWAGYALANDAGVYLVYVRAKTHLVHPNVAKPPSGKLSYEWLDTITGETTEPVTMDWKGWLGLPPPTQANDCVLIMKTVLP